ncbi:MAG: carboxypeptidase regulatory-like domain-containing protein, partial [Terriglobia bacterium]
MSLLTLAGCIAKRSNTHLALTGIVSSDAEGPMEGVLVSAKRVGGTITVTVVSDNQGRYTFPVGRLERGPYAITVRAVGYQPLQLEMATTVGPNGSEYNIKLQKTSDLAEQLTSAEWVMSAPGTAAQKASLFACTQCHTATQVFKSTYDAASWQPTLVRMWNYDPGSTLSDPVPLPYHVGPKPEDKELAKYLSTINLSGGKSTWSFPLKTLPRPKGKETHVIITEYDLPRADAAPHDAIMDSNGMIWYDDDRQAILGRLDPRTGQTKEWPLPIVKPGFNPGSLNLAVDHAGNVWIARLFQAAVARFDPKTGKITTWSEPAKYNNVHSRTSHLGVTPDDKVWFADTFDRLLNLLDPATGHISTSPAFPTWKWSWAADAGSGDRGKNPEGHFIFGVGSDSRNWAIFADKAGSNIGVMDPAGKTVLYPTPTVNSGPRE